LSNPTHRQTDQSSYKPKQRHDLYIGDDLVLFVE